MGQAGKERPAMGRLRTAAKAVVRPLLGDCADTNRESAR